MSKILNVPYKCQNDADANLKRTDCGPACIAMILGALGQTVTTNAVVAASGMQGDNGLMQSQVVNAAKAFGLSMDWSAGYTLADLKRFIDEGRPPIALIKYGNIPDRVDVNYTGGHYVVVVGYDDQRVYINDPDYRPGTNGGFQRGYDFATWLNAWGGFAVGENLNFCLIVPAPPQPVGGQDIGGAPVDVSARDAWVVAPAGLLFRAQPNASAGIIGGLVFGQHVSAIGAEVTPADTSGRTWQQVRSDAGLTGWVAASLGGERLLADSQPEEPYVVQVIDAPEIRQAGGLAVREARNLMLTPIDRVQPGERLTVFRRVVEANGTPWLWVQSPRMQYGWSREESQGQKLVSRTIVDLSGNGATPEPDRNTPSPVAEKTDAWVAAKDGLNLRPKPNRANTPLLTVARGDHLTLIAQPGAPDAEGIVWQEALTDAGQLGWVAVSVGGEATVQAAPVEVVVTSVVPWGKCLAGLGMGDVQPLTPQQLDIVARSKVEAFKILTLPDPGQNKQLIQQLRSIRSDMFIVARLFFSVDHASRTKFNPIDFFNFVEKGFTACCEAGVEYFEVHNEPNLDIEGNGWNWADGQAFGSWLIGVLQLLRQRCPSAKFGYPGLSPQPNVPAFLDGSAAAIAQCDWIGAHSYWQQPAHQPPFPINGLNAGFFWRGCRDRFPDKLLMVTEFSNNSGHVSDADKGNQYGEYYRLLRREPNVGAAFAFALNWPGQDHNREGWEFKGGVTAIPDRVAQAINAGL